MEKRKLEELESYINELKTIRREVVETQKYFLTSKKYNCTLSSGIVIPREQLFKNNSDGSAVIVVPKLKSSDEYIVTIEPRVFTKRTVAVGFPAGYIEENESSYNAALRELREETGYVPTKLDLLDSFYQDEGVSSAYNYIYLASDCEQRYKQQLDENEIVRYMTFNYDELLELERLGYICSSNTKLALTKIKKED